MTPEARRLHPASIGVGIVRNLRGLALPLVALIFVGSPDAGRALLYGGAGIAFAVVTAVWRWATTRWYLDEDAVRLRVVFLGENVTSIPYDRVQAVDTVRGPIQRLFGVAELHVQAAGGGAHGEIVLPAITARDAEELRQTVRAEAPAGAAAAAPEPAADAHTWALGRGPLLVAAATSGSLAVLLPVVAAASQVADDLLGFQDAQRLLPDTVGEAAVVGAFVLAAAWVLSFLGTIVAFAGFTAVRDGERLRIRRGVLERREASIPVARVHAVRIVESPLRQPLGLAQLRIETAGYAREEASAQTLLPLVRRSDVRAILRELLPEHAAAFDEVDPLPRRALRRYVLPPTALAALLAAAAVIAFGADGLPVLVLVALALVTGVARHRAAGVGLPGAHVVLRSRTRTLVRTTSAADARRLQGVRTRATPFQRRGRLATLAVDVSSGRRLRVDHLDREVADGLFARLAAAAAAPR